MKKNYFLKQLLLLAFIVGVTSCKKDKSIPSEENAINKNEIASIKKWYDAKRLAETVEWEKASFSEAENKYHIPVKPKMQLSSAFLHSELIVANNNDKNATFVYTITKDKIKYQSEENSVINAVFDTENHFLNGTYSRDGIIKDRIETKPIVLTNDNTNYGKEGWVTQANVPCGETMYNGFIVYDMETGQILGFIIVNEVHGLCPTNTESGGGGSGNPPPVVDCTNASEFLNSISYSSTNSVSPYLMGPITVASDGKIRRPVAPKGALHQYSFIFGIQIVYREHFTGIIYRNNASDPTWKWESFTYSGFYPVSGNLPNNTEAVINPAVSTAISGDQKIASSTGNVIITFKYNCLGNVVFGYPKNAPIWNTFHAGNEAD
jgi:hypothetical protein